MAKLLKTDGSTVEDVDISTLKSMQDLVGGYIELVYLPDQKVFIVNEEGILNNLASNDLATEIYGHLIVGDVILANTSEIN